MSLTAYGRDVMDSVTASGAHAAAGPAHGTAQVPRLFGSGGGGGYAAWRPQMEACLMRAGATVRDYADAAMGADWAALVAAVDGWAREDEQASIDYALGRASKGASASKALTAEEKAARKGATEAVTRTRKVYALLYGALCDELRRLVAGIPQGDAYGLWSWLENKFRSTEQDSVGDLWDQFTSRSQDEQESFDAYKARVDHVYGLLAHAKDKPSPGGGSGGCHPR